MKMHKAAKAKDQARYTSVGRGKADRGAGERCFAVSTAAGAREKKVRDKGDDAYGVCVWEGGG